MMQQQWHGDPNPLGGLFRQAYARFLERLRQTDVAGSAAETDAAAAERAALAMHASVLGFTNELGRGAAARLADTERRQAEALCYAYAALVDEQLLNRDWQGRAQWLEHLLENKLFKTREAGQAMFRRMIATLQIESQQSIEIAEVYLHCLNLGFQGLYRGRDDGLEKLLLARKKMFLFVYRRRADLGQGGRLLGEADEVSPIVTPEEQRSLTKPLRWWRYVGGAALLLLLLSAAMWAHVIGVVNPLLDEILRAGP